MNIGTTTLQIYVYALIFLIALIFTARCYAERGKVGKLSVCPSVRNVEVL